MVVVQFLAADEDSNRKEIGRGIGTIEIAVAPVMPEAVDDTRRPERDPDHLPDPDQGARQRTEKHDVDGQHEDDPDLLTRCIDMPLKPVIRRAVTIAAQGLRVARFLDVKKHPAPQHPVDAEHLRTVRVFRRFAFGVMLAVDCRPFLGSHAGGQPQPQAKEMGWQRRQIKRAVRLMAVQENGDGSDGDVRQSKQHKHISPPRQFKNSG